MKKLQLLKIAGGVFVVSAALTGAWNLWFSSTQVGFVNYQVINLGQISKANHNSFIKISEISTDELDDLDTYDMVFINAMGLRITEEQRNMIQHAAQNGLPVLTTAATNPLNNIVSVDEAVADTLKAYLGNGGRKNYASMLDYVRKYVDKNGCGRMNLCRWLDVWFISFIMPTQKILIVKKLVLLMCHSTAIS